VTRGGSKPGERRGGRQKGTPNQLGRDVKEMILGALQAGGGQAWLERQMEANPTAFMTLVGKVLPLQVTGEGGGPIAYQNIDAPVKETRDEWLARQRAPATRGNSSDVVH
jgi:hypothetical protein